MDKRNKKRAKQNNEAEATAQKETGTENKALDKRDADNPGYSDKFYTIGSPKFDEYYKTQFKGIVDDAEYEVFVKTLQEKLPVTFRINSGELGFERVSNMFKDPNYVKNMAVPVEEKKQEETYAQNADMKHVNHGDLNIKTAQLDFNNLRMDVKKYYPQDIVFEMMIPKELLKKNTGLKKVHEVIMKLADSGLITRQEIVSMLPPLLLDVHADHSVFDMCAAPGSKTA